MTWVVASGFIVLWITLSGLVTELKKIRTALELMAMWYGVMAAPGQGDGEEIHGER